METASLDRIDHGLKYLDDSEILRQQLLDDKERLFTEDTLKISVWPESQHELGNLHDITEKRFLDEWMRTVIISNTPHNSFLVLKQHYTHGSLLISLEIFQHLLDTYQIFLPFISCIRAFGASGSDVQYGGYHERISTRSIEICYNIHYPALRKRVSKRLWSIRQMAAYQRYDCETKTSKWIFVQPSEVVERRLGAIIETDWNLDINPALPHLIMLQSAEKDWETYLKYWNKEYEAKKRIARHEKVGTPERAGVKVCFKDSQNLEFIRHQLSDCGAIIASSLETGKSCIEFCERLDGDPNLKEAIRTKFTLYIRRMQIHAHTTELLLEHSKETARLLSQIIDFRNEEATIESNHNMRDLLSVLTELGTSARQENATLLTLNERARKDSRFTKILTFVAMLYLPASLVATVFSSNLLQLISTGDSADETIFVPATQFWIFPAATFVLTCLTIVPALVFQRLQVKKFLRKAPKVHVT